MYRIYILKIKSALKAKLKGLVYVTVSNDTMIIAVDGPFFYYQQTYYNLSEKILNGTPADLFTNDFISHYKQEIYKRLFVRK